MAAETLEPLSPSASYFDLMGVPVAADDALLTRRFHELSRRFHPDRFGTFDAATQTIALQNAALVNDAYRTLRDPFGRAEYLLRRERGTRPDDTKNQKPPQELFARVLELQESLMEYQEAHMEDDAATLARLRPALEAAKADFQAAYEAMADRLRGLFTRYDNTAGAEREKVLDELAQVVGTRGYLRRVLTNLDKTLAAS
jgi:molecular chaperone HscB